MCIGIEINHQTFYNISQHWGDSITVMRTKQYTIQFTIMCQVSPAYDQSGRSVIGPYSDPVQAKPFLYIHDTGKVIHCKLTPGFTRQMKMKNKERKTDHRGLLITYSSLHFFPARTAHVVENGRTVCLKTLKQMNSI